MRQISTPHQAHRFRPIRILPDSPSVVGFEKRQTASSIPSQPREAAGESTTIVVVSSATSRSSIERTSLSLSPPTFTQVETSTPSDTPQHSSTSSAAEEETTKSRRAETSTLSSSTVLVAGAIASQPASHTVVTVHLPVSSTATVSSDGGVFPTAAPRKGTGMDSATRQQVLVACGVIGALFGVLFVSLLLRKLKKGSWGGRGGVKRFTKQGFGPDFQSFAGLPTPSEEEEEKTGFSKLYRSVSSFWVEGRERSGKGRGTGRKGREMGRTENMEEVKSFAVVPTPSTPTYTLQYPHALSTPPRSRSTKYLIVTTPPSRTYSQTRPVSSILYNGNYQSETGENDYFFTVPSGFRSNGSSPKSVRFGGTESRTYFPMLDGDEPTRLPYVQGHVVSPNSSPVQPSPSPSTLQVQGQDIPTQFSTLAQVLQSECRDRSTPRITLRSPSQVRLGHSPSFLSDLKFAANFSGRLD
ncbi:hypothetical protein BT69DRAFT_1342241 [Atractiella rhizophila]|nr:hypothetical protein BT69DRAFT_1342241 [Atractiella rhizophila]